MSSILLPNTDNIASISKLKLAFHTDFASFNPAVFNSGKDWQEIEILPNDGKLSYGHADSDNGNLFQYQVNAKHLMLRDEADDFLDQFVGIRCVAHVTDMNDRVYILGAPGKPCTFNYTGDTDNKNSGANGYSFQIISQQYFRAFSA